MEQSQELSQKTLGVDDEDFAFLITDVFADVVYVGNQVRVLQHTKFKNVKIIFHQELRRKIPRI